MAATTLLCIIFFSGTILFVLGKCTHSCAMDDGQNLVNNCCQERSILCCGGAKETGECLLQTPKSPHDVTDIYIQYCSLSNLSKEAFAKINTSAVAHIHLKEVAIDSISKDAFINFSSLQTLSLDCARSSNLSGLGSAITEGTKVNISVSIENCGIQNGDIPLILANTPASNVRHLSLAHNLIKNFSLYEFHSLISSSSIDLSANQIENIVQTKNVIKIKNLKLSGNNLGFLTTEKWHLLNGTLPNLENLDLSDNKIGNFSVVPWHLFPTLVKLIISHNQIKYLNFSLISHMVNLTDLDISNNWLSESGLSLELCLLPKLKRLSLSRNEFAIFAPPLCNQTIAYFPNLEYLDLSFNLLRKPRKEDWECLAKLKELDLSRNPLFALHNNLFTDLVSLEKLNLSYSHGYINVIEKTAFNITNLKSLDLRYSFIGFGLTANDSSLFMYLNKLTYLDLSYNMFYTQNQTQLSQWLSPLKSIQILNLTNVHISRLPIGLLGRFPNLTHLTLNKNYFGGGTLHESFNSSISLKYLSLSHNYIRVVTNSSFVGRIRETLKELDLSNNPLDCTCSNMWFRDEIDKSKFRYKHWPDRYKCRTPVDNDRLFESFHMSARECAPLDAMIIAYITIGSFMFVFTVTASFVYKFRWYITLWVYKMKRKQRLPKDAESRPLLGPAVEYDAYIMYRHEDETLDRFILREFAPLMERLGYKCFFWDHHAGVGGLKGNEIFEAMYKCRNVISIVNNSFLKDSWYKFQVDITLDRQIEANRQMLMFFVLAEVDLRMLTRFWCVRFTRNPTMMWCSNPDDIRRSLMENQIRNLLGDPGSTNQDLHKQQDQMLLSGQNNINNT